MKATIIKLDEIDSTNSFCKRCNAEEFENDLIVTAVRQSAGRGTKGRSFSSEEGGLYISLMRRLENFDFTNTFTIMIDSCVAVCETLKALGLEPNIKWANDVLVGGKKICGTLIENRLATKNVCTSIVGIGININNPLPDELKDTATSISLEKGKRVSVARVRRLLIKKLRKHYTVADYKSYVGWFGKQIDLICGDEVISAVAVDVDIDGSLVCNVGGQLKKINSAEMSLRLKCNTI